MLDAITDRTRVVLVCTPNNPTGPAVGHTELARFVARVPDRVLVVVDEAYREFVRREDPVDALALYRAHPNVAVTRTFAKAYGLAGLRGGQLLPPGTAAAAGPPRRPAPIGRAEWWGRRGTPGGAVFIKKKYTK